MIYPASFENKIGFSGVRADVAALCSGADARRLARELEFTTNFTAVDSMLRQTHEMLASAVSLRAEEQIPVDGLPSGSFINAGRRLEIEGSVLTPDDFHVLSKALKASERLRQFFASPANTLYPTLSLMARPLPDVGAPVRAIESVFGPDGEVRDNASEQLSDIRMQMRNIGGKINALMRTIIEQAVGQGYLERDTAPSVREGRLVLPVPSMNKRAIKGIVHGESATGRTIYIEPAQIVEANNRSKELAIEEQKEIARILAALTDTLRQYTPDLSVALDILARFDFIRAKALYARKVGGSMPKLHREPEIEWFHAINPELQKTLEHQGKELVPLNLRLDIEHRLLVISGPNAGGKSVCLKTVGIVQYMMQCGLLPPLYSNSHMGIFHNIFIDIGDNQSIEDDLSTYSSHLRDMKLFLQRATPSTLVLIDEFGGGTEPTIGGAIAEAVMLELNRMGCWGVITTHYLNLKLAADSNPGLINGSMLYDRHLMKPLFSLSIGSPGSSFALEIARKSGIPEAILQKATEIVGNDYVDTDKFMLDINRDKKYWEQKRYDIKIKEKKLDRLIEQWESRTAEISQNRASLINEAKKEANRLIKEANANIERTIKDIREANADRERTLQHRRELEEFRQRIAASEPATTFTPPAVRKTRKKPAKTSAAATAKTATIEPGSLVQLDGAGLTGNVVEIKGQRAIVNFGNSKTTVPLERLKLSTEKKAQTVKITSAATRAASDMDRERRMNFKSTIDVRGMRADEALQAVTYFIDDAVRFGQSPVRILHGTGTGALRQSIRQYLSTLAPQVAFRDEDVRMGGAGITVVDIK